MRLLVALVVLAVALLAAEAKMQTVTVKGTVICKGKRVANVKVELWDKDTFDPNDLLKETSSNDEGEFELTGGEDEVTKIEPFIRISHNCQAKENCMRIADYNVPQSHIDSTPYDMSYVALDIAVAGEKTKC